MLEVTRLILVQSASNPRPILVRQMKASAELFEGFSRVAAAQPQHAWFPVERTAADIAHVTDANRWIGYPR